MLMLGWLSGYCYKKINRMTGLGRELTLNYPSKVSFVRKEKLSNVGAIIRA